jgi:hypothetical protein
MLDHVFVLLAPNVPGAGRPGLPSIALLARRAVARMRRTRASRVGLARSAGQEKSMFGNSGDEDARPHNPQRICCEEPDELAYWIEALKVDEPTLRGAIQAVGFTVGDVRDYLKWRQAGRAA